MWNPSFEKWYAYILDTFPELGKQCLIQLEHLEGLTTFEQNKLF